MERIRLIISPCALSRERSSTASCLVADAHCNFHQIFLNHSAVFVDISPEEGGPSLALNSRINTSQHATAYLMALIAEESMGELPDCVERRGLRHSRLYVNDSRYDNRALYSAPESPLSLSTFLKETTSSIMVTISPKEPNVNAATGI